MTCVTCLAKGMALVSKWKLPEQLWFCIFSLAGVDRGCACLPGARGLTDSTYNKHIPGAREMFVTLGHQDKRVVHGVTYEVCRDSMHVIPVCKLSVSCSLAQESVCSKFAWRAHEAGQGAS